MGRFITEDTSRQGHGWYNYCSNNPLTRVDPTGRQDVSSLLYTLVGTSDGPLSVDRMAAGQAALNRATTSTAYVNSYTAKAVSQGFLIGIETWGLKRNPESQFYQKMWANSMRYMGVPEEGIEQGLLEFASATGTKEKTPSGEKPLAIVYGFGWSLTTGNDPRANMIGEVRLSDKYGHGKYEVRSVESFVSTHAVYSRAFAELVGMDPINTLKQIEVCMQAADVNLFTGEGMDDVYKNVFIRGALSYGAITAGRDPGNFYWTELEFYKLAMDHPLKSYFYPEGYDETNYESFINMRVRYGQIDPLAPF